MATTFLLVTMCHDDHTCPVLSCAVLWCAANSTNTTFPPRFESSRGADRIKNRDATIYYCPQHFTPRTHIIVYDLINVRIKQFLFKQLTHHYYYMQLMLLLFIITINIINAIKLIIIIK